MRWSICAVCSGFSITSASVSSSLSVPRAQLAGGALQYEHAEIDNEADLLGHGDELGRRGAAHFGMIPARHRLKARDRAVLEPHDRLVEDGDLLALERPP